VPPTRFGSATLRTVGVADGVRAGGLDVVGAAEMAAAGSDVAGSDADGVVDPPDPVAVVPWSVSGWQAVTSSKPATMT